MCQLSGRSRFPVCGAPQRRRAHIRKSNVIQNLNVPAIGAIKRILNRYSFSVVFDVDMSSKPAIQRRGEVVAEMILAWIARPGTHG